MVMECLTSRSSEPYSQDWYYKLPRMTHTCLVGLELVRHQSAKTGDLTGSMPMLHSCLIVASCIIASRCSHYAMFEMIWWGRPPHEQASATAAGGIYATRNGWPKLLARQCAFWTSLSLSTEGKHLKPCFSYCK